MTPLDRYNNIETMEDKLMYLLNLKDEDKEKLLFEIREKDPREYRKLKGRLNSAENESTLFEETGTTKIRLDQIKPNPFQPREEFDDAQLQKLVQSIKTYGQLQPIMVSKLSNNQFTIIMGERRYRAVSILAKEDPSFQEIEAKILNNPTPEAQEEMAIAENTHRVNLSVYEEANAYLKLNERMTVQQIADKFGESKSRVGRLVKIAKMQPEIIQYAKEKEIKSLTFLELLSKETDTEKQKKMIEDYAQQNSSIKQIEEQYLEPKEDIQSKPDDKILEEFDEELQPIETKKEEPNSDTAEIEKIDVKIKDNKISIKVFSEEQKKAIIDFLEANFDY